MGEGERGLWRQGGRRRELGDTGEVGEIGGVVDGASCTGSLASEDMVCEGHCSSDGNTTYCGGKATMSSACDLAHRFSGQRAN